MFGATRGLLGDLPGLLLAALWATPLLAGCGARQPQDEAAPVVFRHAKLFGDPRPLDELIAAFERDSGIRVKRETLPAASDEQHLFYAINLRARSSEFDVLALDVIWVAEFARAGWLRELSHLLSAQAREDLFPGALAAASWNGRVYALPWFIDAGLLYYRKDLLNAHGIAPPKTWQDLVNAARTVTPANPGLYGFVWQGKQYEGLVCNAMEFVWSHGGEIPARGSATFNRAGEPAVFISAGKPAVAASERGLAFMRALVVDGITPALVTTLTEEPSRVIFGQGRALFLRNWPYAWKLFEREGSPVRGKVGVTPLPHAPGYESAATLGGWQLGVNAFSTRPQAAERLAAFLASPRAHKAIALAYGYSPPRRTLFADPEIAASQPFFASLREVFETARPRPVSPDYVALSQELQAQFSAVLTGGRSPHAALAAVAEAAARLQSQ
jgi:multiple sugar transport system substrate-binding protein